MSFKSVSTVVFGSLEAQGAFEYAISAARHWGAHLHVLCAGVDTADPGFYYAGAQAIAVQHNLEQAQADVAQVGAQVKARMACEDITWDVEVVTMMANCLEPFLTNHMRFFDLAILPLPDGRGRWVIKTTVFEACLFGAEIPVLVVPDQGVQPAPASRVLLGWDDSAEALRAARASVPLTSTVDVTEICIIAPSRLSADRSDPGGRLAQMLVRSGASVEIRVAARLQADIADQLLQRASETGAELIVMGGYGHSRLREAIIGGVTRSMLCKTSIPVLMAH